MHFRQLQFVLFTVVSLLPNVSEAIISEDNEEATNFDLTETFLEANVSRSKRQIFRPNSHIRAWQRIYLFSIQMARVAGNNALLANMIDRINYDTGGVSRLYTYGYYGRRRYGYGYGGYGYGYGGYPFSQPIVYYVPVSQQSLFPFNGIYDFTGDVGGTVSNTDLLEQLINLIQQAIDETYSSYDDGSGGGDGGGGQDTEAPA